jgi:CIC family chloride channel protein
MLRRGKMPSNGKNRAIRRLRVGSWQLRHRLRRTDVRSQLILWPIAVAIGVITGYAVILFRTAISWLQGLFYGGTDEMIHSVAAALPWYVVLSVPVGGGLVVGAILTIATRDARARGVDAVIEAAAIHTGRVDRRVGIASSLAALVTLSTGGSTGREGPAIHIGAVLASWVSDRLKAPPVTARDILGCAAAAAVSASFNAPLAGALFALEVVLRHYALHAFGPIVISSVAAAVVSRIHLGDVTEFSLPAQSIAFYWEIPAFAILGILSGFVGVVMIRTLFVAEGVADRIQRKLAMPDWLRPAVAGAMLGVIALQFPHIIGVGYETTTLALTTQLAFFTAVIFAVVKVAAVAVTFAGRMGGGVFSPAVMLGALTGCAFGEVAIQIFPSVSGSQGLYALAGMGAVAGAVLGAPISSTLIVFELTADWQAGIAVMISVSLASVVADRMVARSFFLTQLERRGLHLSDGPQGYIAATMPVMHLMRHRGADDCASDTACWALVEQGAYLRRDDTLERALPMLERLPGGFLPVVDGTVSEPTTPELLGALFQTDALSAYTHALEDELREEHG